MLGTVCSMLLIKKKVKKNATKLRKHFQALKQHFIRHNLKYEVSGTGSSSLRSFMMTNRITASTISINADKVVDTKIMSLFSCVLAI